MPGSLLHAAAPLEFYYTRVEQNQTDSITWIATYDDSGKKRILYAPYLDGHDSLCLFTKEHQPYEITLTYGLGSVQNKFACHWDSSINWPVNRGLLWLPTPLDSSDLDSNHEPYPFKVAEGFGDYPGPPFALDWGKTDTVYRYHTFAVEILPSEIRFLYDSNVVRRIPDRLIPLGDTENDLAWKLPRSHFNFFIGQLDQDNNDDAHTDPFGNDSGSITWEQRQSFEHAAASPSWAGFWPYHGKNVAHDLIDYVRVWDVPSDMKIPDFPH